MDLIITQEEAGAEITLTAQGRITTSNADTLEKALNEALEKDFDLVILDMFKVALLTSTGIRVILKTYRAAVSKNKKFQIASPSEAVRNVLGLSNLELMLVK